MNAELHATETREHENTRRGAANQVCQCEEQRRTAMPQNPPARGKAMAEQIPEVAKPNTFYCNIQKICEELTE